MHVKEPKVLSAVFLQVPLAAAEISKMQVKFDYCLFQYS